MENGRTPASAPQLGESSAPERERSSPVDEQTSRKLEQKLVRVLMVELPLGELLLATCAGRDAACRRRTAHRHLRARQRCISSPAADPSGAAPHHHQIAGNPS